MKGTRHLPKGTWNPAYLEVASRWRPPLRGAVAGGVVEAVPAPRRAVPGVPCEEAVAWTRRLLPADAQPASGARRLPGLLRLFTDILGMLTGWGEVGGRCSFPVPLGDV